VLVCLVLLRSGVCAIKTPVALPVRVGDEAEGTVGCGIVLLLLLCTEFDCTVCAVDCMSRTPLVWVVQSDVWTVDCVHGDAFGTVSAERAAVIDDGVLDTAELNCVCMFGCSVCDTDAVSGNTVSCVGCVSGPVCVLTAWVACGVDAGVAVSV
jgi:hypothetical protein